MHLIATFMYIKQEYTQEDMFLRACASLGEAYLESRILAPLKDCSSVKEVITTGSDMAIHESDEHEYVSSYFNKPYFRIQYQYGILSITVEIITHIQPYSEENSEFYNIITIYFPDDQFGEFLPLEPKEYQEILQRQ